MPRDEEWDKARDEVSCLDSIGDAMRWMQSKPQDSGKEERQDHREPPGGGGHRKAEQGGKAAMIIHEFFDLYRKLEGQLRESATIAKENVLATEASAIHADTFPTFDEVRGRIIQKVASLRDESDSCREFLQQCDSMPPSERLEQYGAVAKEAQEEVSNLRREIDKVSLAERPEVDFVREHAREGLTVVMERAGGGQA